MSDSNLAAVAFQREPAWGVPSNPATLKLLRFTKENLERGKDIEKSNEIRSDRRQGESVEVGITAKGGFDFELSVGDQDLFLESALMGAFADAAGVDTLIDGTTRTSYLIEKKLLTAAFMPFTGCMLDTLAINLTSKKIVTGTANFLGQNGTASTTSLATRRSGTLTLAGNAADGETVTVGGKVYTFQASLTNVNGNVKVGASAAASITNLINAINLGTGAGTTYAAAMTLNAGVTAYEAAGDTMLVVEKAGVTATSATTETLATGGSAWGAANLAGGAGYVAAGTGLILSASAHVGNITKGVGGAALAGLKTLSLMINNNLRGNDEIGRKDIGEVGLGSILVTGKADAYFRDLDLLTEFMNHSSSAISFEVSREAEGAVSGDLIGYRFTIPKLKWTKGPVVVPGKDTDVMLPLEFEAEVGVFNAAPATMAVEKLEKA